jgi:cytosine/adenosine deaminase-related metal-dependent hydrolase
MTEPACAAPSDAAADVLLVTGADVLVTLDAARRELPGAGVLAIGGRIEAVGDTATLEAALRSARAGGRAGGRVRRLDAQGCVVTPGLVNTHHHMYQSLTRAVPAAQDADLFGWLRTLYPIWARFTPAMFVTAAEVAMVELLRSGCTTSSDHQYLFPNGARLDDTIEAARRLGLRFHACRGSMSVGESAGGLPPDALVEDEDAILADSERVVARWHDPSPGAMTRVALAPCSPFSVSPRLMRESAVLARRLGARLHTHLAENDDDVAYSRERFGMTPAQYAESLGWLGDDVWHAHCVKLDEAGIARFGATRTGIAHCPCSNMRLASGIAPVPAWRRAGLRVGLGVDGSASNDGAQMLGEARQALLLARVGHGPSALRARDALEMATLGGARVLGRDDIGALEVGRRADLAIWDLSGIEHAGAQHDPVAALLFCAPARTAWTVVEGRVVVEGGRLVSGDEAAIARRQRASVDRLRDTG